MCSPEACHQMSLLVAKSRGYAAQSSAYEEKTYATNVQEYNEVMYRLARRRLGYMLRDVYEDLLMDGLQPDRDTFHLAIPACMRTNRLQDAFYFFEEMKSTGMVPDLSLYNCIISTCGQCMQPDRAFQVAEEMETMGIQPKLRTFVALLNACGSAGRVEEAMTEHGLTLSPYCYAALITAHKNSRGAPAAALKAGTVATILELLEQSKAKGAEVADDELLTGGDLEHRHDLEDHTRRAAGSRHAVVHHAALRAMVDLRSYDGVEKVLGIMKADGIKVDAFTYTELIRSSLMRHDLDKALDAFEQLTDNGISPSLDLYVMLIESAIQQYSPESLASAKRLLREMDQAGFFLNARIGGNLLQMAAKERIGLGDYSTATLVFELTQRRQQPPFAPTLLYLRGLLNRGISEEDPRVIAARKIVTNNVRYGGSKLDVEKKTRERGQESAAKREEGTSTSS
eukprot:jgi/Mesen1/7575/ME000392S06834